MNTPDSLVTPATGSVMNEPTGSFDGAVGSPVTSLSITNYAADLTLLSEPLITLPEVMLLKPALAQCGLTRTLAAALTRTGPVGRSVASGLVTRRAI